LTDEEIRKIANECFNEISEAYLVQSNLYKDLTTGEKQSFTLKYAPVNGDIVDWAIGVTTQKHVTKKNLDQWK
jgi:hypothetical protein